MRRRLPCTAFLSLLVLASLAAAPSLTAQDPCTIKAVGIKSVNIWYGMSQAMGEPRIERNEGRDLIVVEYECRDPANGEINTDEMLGDFGLEDASGNTYMSIVTATSVRRIPFDVPEGIVLKVFRVRGLETDIRDLPIEIAEISEW